MVAFGTVMIVLGETPVQQDKNFGTRKLNQNIQHDQKNQLKLLELGWSFLVVWECETKDRTQLEKFLQTFIETPIPTEAC